MDSSKKTSAGVLPIVALVVAGIALIIDHAVTGRFGVSRYIAYACGAVFLVSIVVALMRTGKADK